MHGAEYDELCEAVANYEDKFESVKIAEPLLGEVGADASAVNDDKKLQKQSLLRQLRLLDMTVQTLQQRTEPHLYSWDMVLPIPQKFPTARCRHRWTSLDIRTYSSEL